MEDDPLSSLVLYFQVLVRLVGFDDHFYHNSLDVMQWLADSNLLEMIVDKLNTSVSYKTGIMGLWFMH